MSRFASLSVLLFVACTSQGLPSTTHAPDSGLAGSSVAASSADLGLASQSDLAPDDLAWPTSGDLAAAGPQLAACGTPQGAVVASASAAQTLQLLVGRWLACTAMPFGPTDGAGIEITAQQTYSILVWGSDGTLVEKQGFDYGGTVEGLENGSSGQINFYPNTGGFEIITTAAFEATPRRMDLYPMSVFIAVN